MEDIDRRNVTFETWQLLKIADAAIRNGANLTLNTLASLARGSRGGAYEVTTASGKKGKQKMKATEKLDLELVVGGAVELSKDVCHLCTPFLTSVDAFFFIRTSKYYWWSSSSKNTSKKNIIKPPTPQMYT